MTPNHVSTEAQKSSLRLLAVSFSFPPLAYPRSIQVARLVKYMPFPVVMVCADEPDARKDPTLEPDAEAVLQACLRVPFNIPKWRRYVNAAAYHYRRPLWNRWNLAPDGYRAWMAPALAAVERYARADAYKPEVLATFSQPAIDHLVGLELKRRFRVPWVAHFSDPWADNPYHHYDERTARINLALEREVIETADRLIFTSQETVDVVMSKYPASWKAKALVLPQCYDPAAYPVAADDTHGATATGNAAISNATMSSAATIEAAANGDRLLIRHLGNFYHQRTPAPLFRALRSLLDAEPAMLAGVRFDLVGVTDASTFKELGLEGLPDGLVTVNPPVGYRESLALMSQADGLLVIDAPMEQSIFLPSKLIDYIGAGRPILGLTPPGTAAKLIHELGGWIADPTDTPTAIQSAAAALRDFLTFLRRRRDAQSLAWGAPEVRRRFEARHQTAAFAAVVEELRAEASLPR